MLLRTHDSATDQRTKSHSARPAAATTPPTRVAGEPSLRSAVATSVVSRTAAPSSAPSTRSTRRRIASTTSSTNTLPIQRNPTSSFGQLSAS